jgi:hypothetical protein
VQAEEDAVSDHIDALHFAFGIDGRCQREFSYCAGTATEHPNERIVASLGPLVAVPPAFIDTLRSFIGRCVVGRGSWCLTRADERKWAEFLSSPQFFNVDRVRR